MENPTLPLIGIEISAHLIELYSRLLAGIFQLGISRSRNVISNGNGVGQGFGCRPMPWLVEHPDFNCRVIWAHSRRLRVVWGGSGRIPSVVLFGERCTNCWEMFVPRSEGGVKSTSLRARLWRPFGASSSDGLSRCLAEETSGVGGAGDAVTFAGSAHTERVAEEIESLGADQDIPVEAEGEVLVEVEESVPEYRGVFSPDYDPRCDNELTVVDMQIVRGFLVYLFGTLLFPDPLKSNPRVQFVWAVRDLQYIHQVA
ncbi:hypothetical protein AMTR_s00008p00207370 [Amborella trichopoda]|uniref:Uncharacterized protein n=1 Tax=Amborella trichopoda TaxID=13333 RepID=W1NHW3_AMBTC|nr:hypothetical protein AMTR_s00008p00207370 [Amborella trichopoda]